MIPQGLGQGWRLFAPKREAFRASLAALPVVNASADCRWRREECGGITALVFEALQLKTAVK